MSVYHVSLTLLSLKMGRNCITILKGIPLAAENETEDSTESISARQKGNLKLLKIGTNEMKRASLIFMREDLFLSRVLLLLTTLQLFKRSSAWSCSERKSQFSNESHPQLHSLLSHKLLLPCVKYIHVYIY